MMNEVPYRENVETYSPYHPVSVSINAIIGGLSGYGIISDGVTLITEVFSA